MPGQITIAIDGHSSCGKSTLARSLASELDYVHIDSGAMYRAVTFFFLEGRVDIADQKQVQNALDTLTLELKADTTKTQVILEGRVLKDELRSMEVNRHVSEVAKISSVRRHLVQIQRAQRGASGIVMDGRDIGSVVFPDAELKLFLSASIEVRTERRYLELTQSNKSISRSEVSKNLQQRDKIDSGRADSPLLQTADAVYMDNSNLTQAEQLAMVLSLAKIRAESAH